MTIPDSKEEDPKPDLVHCIYCSASAKGSYTEKELEDILTVSRKNNLRSDVTGILLYFNGSIFQVLEGERPVVERVFDKISQDIRHAKVTKLIFESIEQRDFAHWTMGYPKVTAAELAGIPGLNDFYLYGKSYLELGEGRAKKLLAAFREGQWRVTI